MKTNRLPGAIILIASLTLLTGCVTRWSVKDEPRRKILFASPQAAQTFYDAFLALNQPSPPKHSGRVYIPLPYRHFTVTTGNVRFNAAIKLTDGDEDGVISDNEAAAYATNTKPPGVKSAP